MCGGWVAGKGVRLKEDNDMFKASGPWMARGRAVDCGS